MTDMPETAWLAPQQFGKPGVRIGTWSEWKAYDTTEYVRGDIHQALQAEKEELEAKLEAWECAVQSLHSGDGLDKCALAVERFISPLNVPDRPSHAIQIGIRWVLDELRKRAAIDEN